MKKSCTSHSRGIVWKKCEIMIKNKKNKINFFSGYNNFSFWHCFQFLVFLFHENEMFFFLKLSCFWVTLYVTFVIGPVVDNCERWSVDVGLGFDLNAVIVWLTPSANMNCSRSSIFVLPFATVYYIVHAIS